MKFNKTDLIKNTCIGTVDVLFELPAHRSRKNGCYSIVDDKMFCDLLFKNKSAYKINFFPWAGVYVITFKVHSRSYDELREFVAECAATCDFRD